MLERIFDNVKTSTAGVVSCIVGLVAIFGIDLDPTVVSSALAVLIAVVGLFAKD